MKKLCKLLGGCSVMAMLPMVANAAGTYYTGNYQSPQQARYTQKSYTNTAATRTGTYASRGVSNYNRNQYANAGYTTARSTQKTTQSAEKNTNKNGLYLNAGMSKQSAMWQFEMNTAKSKLHYDNLDWLVFDVGGKYVFDAGKTKMQIDAGLQYGLQMGESSMIDDDISHGGYDEIVYETKYGDPFDGVVSGRAISVGTSKDGSMFGFNAGFGLTDFWQIGNLKITPSLGWRHLKYKLETSNNYGMSMLNADFDNSCVVFEDGSTQCAPVIGVFYIDDKDGENNIKYSYPGYVYFDGDLNRLDIEGDKFVDKNGNIVDPVYAAVDVSAGEYAEAQGSFYFHLPDVSHSYDVTWSGPYFALDMQYDINQNNIVTARMELGLPSYTAEGDQPYRFDWAHPKSVEDKGRIGSAFHFGAGANWSTAITDRVSLSIGVTYDYYTVSDADATTYLNAAYWENVYNIAFSDWKKVLNDKYALGLSDGEIEGYMLNGIAIENDSGEIVEYAPEYAAIARANGWKDKVDSEIESFYKSLGVRVGFNARF